MADDLDEISTDEAIEQMDAPLEIEDENNEAPETDIDAPDDVDGEPEQEEQPADSEADGELVQWGEGDDAKEAKLEDLISAFEAGQAPTDFTTNPEYQQAIQTTQQQAAYHNQTAQQLTQFAGQMQQNYQSVLSHLHPGDPPSPSVAAEDPQSYHLLKADWDARALDYNQAYTQMQNDMQVVQQQQSGAMQHYRQQEYSKLVKAWPEWTDTTVQQKAYKMLGDYGFTANDLQSITDSRFHLVLKDLMELKAGSAAGKKATKKLVTKGAPRRIKSRSTSGKSDTAVNRIRAKAKKGSAISDEEALYLMDNG